MEKIKEFVKQHKAITITIVIVVLLIIIGLIPTGSSQKTETKKTDQQKQILYQNLQMLSQFLKQYRDTYGIEDGNYSRKGSDVILTFYIPAKEVGIINAAQICDYFWLKYKEKNAPVFMKIILKAGDKEFEAYRNDEMAIYTQCNFLIDKFDYLTYRDTARELCNHLAKVYNKNQWVEVTLQEGGITQAVAKYSPLTNRIEVN
ncbi:MAG TPA: hypothetical protein PK165_07220 [bacterium]|nr:hypothetical protein [bacterium]HPO52603.1 hypothetical protein [bacterium]